MPGKNLLDVPEVLDWLTRFDEPDQLMAAQLLRRLRLVSTTQFEEGLQKSLQTLIGVVGPEPMALFVVDRKAAQRQADILGAFARRSPAPSPLPPLGIPPTGAGRVRHFLETRKALLPSGVRVLIEPNAKQMRAQRVRHIVLFDDVVGSGGSVLDFWHAWPERKTVTSWISSGRCKLWLVAFAVHQRGKRKVLKLPGIAKDRVLCQWRLPNEAPMDTPLRQLCSDYADRTSHEAQALGYGDAEMLIVFEYRCPNNCPAILWSSGRGKDPHAWKALFPKRSVPAYLVPCFGQPVELAAQIAPLAEAGQRGLAERLLARAQIQHIDRQFASVLILLGFLSRGITVERLGHYSTLSPSEINEQLAAAVELGLLAADAKLTLFGKELVRRHRAPSNQPVKRVVSDLKFYYPRQYMGGSAKN